MPNADRSLPKVRSPSISQAIVERRLRHWTLSVGRWTLDVRSHHSPLTTHHSPLTTHHSPLTIHRPTLATHPFHAPNPPPFRDLNNPFLNLFTLALTLFSTSAHPNLNLCAFARHSAHRMEQPARKRGARPGEPGGYGGLARRSEPYEGHAKSYPDHTKFIPSAYPADGAKMAHCDHKIREDRIGADVSDDKNNTKSYPPTVRRCRRGGDPMLYLP